MVAAFVAGSMAVAVAAGRKVVIAGMKEEERRSMLTWSHLKVLSRA